MPFHELIALMPGVIMSNASDLALKAGFCHRNLSKYIKIMHSEDKDAVYIVRGELPHSSEVFKMGDKEKGNAPEKKFRVGAVVATVWKNTAKKDGKEYINYSASMERSYKDGEEWKTTNSYKLNDIPKAVLALNKAYEYIAVSSKEEKED